MDLSLFNDAVAQAPAVCKPIIKTVVKTVPHLVGVTYKWALISTVISFVVGGGLSWMFFKPKKEAVVAPAEVVDAPKA